MKKYYIPYPYSFSILFLAIINIIGTIYALPTLEVLNHLLRVLFLTIIGCIQIHGLQNLGNSPAWTFPKGSSFFQDHNIPFYKNIIMEDFFFVPCCGNLFLLFMNFTQGIPDIIQETNMLKILILIFIITQGAIYQAGGLGCRILMIGYGLAPLLWIILQLFVFKSINHTHFLLSFAFVASINCGWEYFNVWREHWKYNKNSNMLSEVGWFLDKKLHISIFVEFAIVGFLVTYFVDIF